MNIPNPTHKNYQALIEGNTNFPIKVLALKILLQKLRLEYSLNKKFDPKYSQELYDFLQKNTKLCEEDIANIFK